MLQAKEALSVGNGTGEARWWFGTLAEIKATAADTGGLCTIVEVTCGPGYESALHVHHREDEGFWVLDGQVTLEAGGTDRKSTRLNSSHQIISYAVFSLQK